MPPKNKKELELEAQKAAEEAARLAEEERIRKEEERKKYEVKQLETGLKCVFSDYYIQECFNPAQQDDPRAFTKNYLANFSFAEQRIAQNFREIDWKTLIEFTLYNLRFAKIELELSNLNAKVFVNIMHEVISQHDPKYTAVEVPESVKDNEDDAYKYVSSKIRHQGDKTRAKDFAALKSLLISHSTDQPPTKAKYFNAEQLKKMFEYANNSYFANFNLYSFVQRKEQRQKDVYQTVYVDDTNEIPPLAQGTFIPRDRKDDEQIEREKQLLLQEQLAAERDRLKAEKTSAYASTISHEDEDELDPIALEIIREKIAETERTMQKQLEDRKIALDEKLNEISQPKGKAAKK